MSWLTDIFQFSNGKIRQALQEGGVIIDLRPPYEYDQGHIPRSLNIPVDRIKMSTGRIRSLAKPVILCCANGSHCWEAVNILRAAGINRVYHGGNWQSLWKLKRSL